MDTARFQRLEQLFHRAAAADRRERASLLERECADDPRLRSDLERMLRDHDALGQESMLQAGEALRRELIAAPPVDETLPDRIGPFTILGEIARGGFGRVLRADDTRIGRHVAIKVLRREYAANAAAAARLLEEGRLGGRLQHPSIVPVYEIGSTAAGEPFLCMKVVEGRTLASLLAERRDPTVEPGRFVAIFERICQAMAYAHERGVVHRDLKPHNVMVGEFGEVQVMDWGLAVTLGGADSMDPGRPVSGTPAYMAPEQATGDTRSIDRRTDVFGLGAVLCEILTGMPPYGGGDSATALARARGAELADAKARLSRCSGDDRGLADLAGRCLRPEPDQRPANAAAVAAAVHGHVESQAARLHAAEVAASSANARATADRKARRLAVALAAVVVLVTLGGTAAWITLEQRARSRTIVAGQRLTEALLDADRRAAAAEAGPGNDPAAWEAALLAARSAGSLAAADVNAELADRARTLLQAVSSQHADFTFVRSMAAAAAEASTINSVDRRPAALAMQRLVAERLGTPIDAADPAVAARDLTAIRWRDELIVALDAWTRIELEFDRRSPIAGRTRSIADRLDDDPFRREVRTAVMDRDLAALRRLAHAEALDHAWAATARQLALALLGANDLTTMAIVLRRSIERHPDDFETLIDLSWLLLAGHESIDMDEVERYAKIALAIHPTHPNPHELLARIAMRRFNTSAALAHVTRALELSPDGPEFRRTRALIHIDLGDLDAADADLAHALAHTPENHAIYPSLLAQVADLRGRQDRLAEAIDLARQAIMTPHCFPEYVALLDCDPTTRRKLIATGTVMSAADPDDWVLHWLLGRLNEPVDLVASLHHYERVTGCPKMFVSDTNQRIVELRARSPGRPKSRLSAEATVAALPAGVDFAAELQRLGPTLQQLIGEGQASVAAHLEGLLLERSGRAEAAAARYRAAIAADPDAIEAFRRLHACRAALAGRTAADAEVRELLGARLPTGTLLLPLPPPDLRVEPRDDGALVLRWTPHQVIDERAPAVAVDIDIREAARRDVETDRACWLSARDVDGRASLPRGCLVPGRDYVVSAQRRHTGRSESSRWCEPLLWRIAAAGCEPRPIDLTAHFDRDVVANPGDDRDDLFDAKNGYRLTVDGFDGTRSDVTSVRGLPLDRVVGPFQLGDYSRPQAIGFDARLRKPLRIELPPDHYLGLHFLVAAANGHTTLPVVVVYDDDRAPEQAVPLYVADWFSSSRPPEVGDKNVGTAVRGGMDRMGVATLEERDAACLFDNFLVTDPTRRARAIVILPEQSRRTSSDSTTMLFAITAVRIEPAPR